MKFPLFALCLAACAGPDQFARRAAFDLNCPEGQLQFVELGRHVWGVRGCGQQATYQRSCVATGYLRNGGVTSPINKCDWVRN